MISEENIIDTVSLFINDKTFESLKEIENELCEVMNYSLEKEVK